ncbi:MAG: hypothetical protein CVU89_04450 [Firmicutes bacterium HGW-Firmicutes-14]|nr:MAG: hypothetical protein CVU89_04450 [Firmicutes bacterium HGW-Firmicutes-14]
MSSSYHPFRALARMQTLNFRPVTGYYISSFGMASVEDNSPGEKFEGHGYTDYFFLIDRLNFRWSIKLS